MLAINLRREDSFSPRFFSLTTFWQFDILFNSVPGFDHQRRFQPDDSFDPGI